MTVPKVETTYVSGDRWYINKSTQARAPGVSAILNMMPKPALMRWAAKEAAIFAVREMEAVAALSRSDNQAAIDLIKGAPWRKSGKAADAGTEVHGLTEQLNRDLLSGRKSDFRVPQGTMPFLRNFARFVTEFDVSPVAVETTVWDDEVDYAGTFDGIYDITMPDPMPAPYMYLQSGVPAVPGDRMRVMVDTKTGASGVWPEAALQQTAYTRAKYRIEPATGLKVPMYTVDGAAALWLRPDGWALIPLNVGNENWEQFKRLRASFEWKRMHEKHAVGKALNAHPLTRKWKGGS